VKHAWSPSFAIPGEHSALICRAWKAEETGDDFVLVSPPSKKYNAALPVTCLMTCCLTIVASSKK